MIRQLSGISQGILNNKHSQSNLQAKIICFSVNEMTIFIYCDSSMILEEVRPKCRRSYCLIYTVTPITPAMATILVPS